MDRVRFGRALGYGARHAVRTLVAAADAATADDPKGKTAQQKATSAARVAPVERAQNAGGGGASRVVSAGGNAGRAAGKTVVQAKEVKSGVGRGSKRLGEAVWRPFVRLSGVLWLEVTGVFFGVFALSAATAVLRLRGSWHATAENAAGHRNLIFALVMLVVFGYFSVSSFVRAKRRERGR